MLSPAHNITTDIIEEICEVIQKGAFETDAAAFVGISPETYFTWLSNGLTPEPSNPLYAELVWKVEQAKAYARVKAAWKMMEKATKTWLLQGPGKNDSSNQWTQPHKAPTIQQTQQINIASDPQIAAFLQTVMLALSQFPEAKSAVAEALAGRNQKEPIPISTRN